MSDADATARKIASTQHGVVAVRQLRAAGLSRHQIRNLAGPHGRWHQVSDEVLRLVGSPEHAEQRTASAVLDAGPGAALSDQSAGRWWGLTGCALEPTVITRTSGTRRPSALAVVRRVRFLPPGWLTVHRGVPVVRPEMLALQLHACCRAERAERLVDRLWSMRLLSGGSLAGFLSEVPRRGVRGSAALRRYVASRGADYRPPDSGLESRFQQISAAAGFTFRRQVDVGGQRWTGRVDFLHADQPLVVEVQSEAFHSSLVDRRADSARLAAMRAQGFTVVEVTDTMVWTRPDDVVRRIQHGLELCCRRRQR